jgi:hypothetical protein
VALRLGLERRDATRRPRLFRSLMDKMSSTSIAPTRWSRWLQTRDAFCTHECHVVGSNASSARTHSLANGAKAARYAACSLRRARRERARCIAVSAPDVEGARLSMGAAPNVKKGK